MLNATAHTASTSRYIVEGITKTLITLFVLIVAMWVRRQRTTLTETLALQSSLAFAKLKLEAVT